MKITKINTSKTTISIIAFLSLAVIVTALLQIFSHEINLNFRRHQLMKAIMNGDVELYLKHAFTDDVSGNFDAETEVRKQITFEILRKYVYETGKPWDLNDYREGITFHSIIISGSPEFSGIGVADTDEGYELLQLAIHKYTAEYPNRANSTLIAEKQENGAVLVGMRLSIQ